MLLSCVVMLQLDLGEGKWGTHVKDSGGVLSRARASSRAHLDGERGVSLSSQGSDLLAKHEAGEGEGGGDLGVHGGQTLGSCLGLLE